MNRQRRTHNLALLLAVALLPLSAACDGDDEPTGQNGLPSALVGSWVATSFVVDGVDVIAAGMTISFNFSADGSYSLLVTGDTEGLFCDTAQTCSESGDLSATGSTLTFDPGTSDETTLSYSISGDTLTVSGTVEGTTLSATLERTS